MLLIHINWMLVIYFFCGAVVVVCFKFIVNYYLQNKGGITTTSTVYQDRLAPERWSISIDMNESQPPEFEEALKFSKPVYRIDVDEPPPPYDLVISNTVTKSNI